MRQPGEMQAVLSVDLCFWCGKDGVLGTQRTRSKMVAQGLPGDHPSFSLVGD